MKRIIATTLLLASFFITMAQKSSGTWQELSDLKEVTTKVISISQGGENDIIKRAAPELFTKATMISKSKTAQNFEKNEKMKKAIAQLVKQTKELADKAKISKDDASLKTMVTAANATLQDIDAQFSKSQK